jgi:molecular chaperone DnaK (HSP70)
LEDAGVGVDDLVAVEVVGGSTRVPAVLAELRSFFGKEPSRTLNAKEVVSRGCALQCAMLSPIFRFARRAGSAGFLSWLAWHPVQRLSGQSCLVD